MPLRPVTRPPESDFNQFPCFFNYRVGAPSRLRCARSGRWQCADRPFVVPPSGGSRTRMPSRAHYERTTQPALVRRNPAADRLRDLTGSAWLQKGNRRPTSPASSERGTGILPVCPRTVLALRFQGQDGPGTCGRGAHVPSCPLLG